jgi:hypothetical protein
MIKIMFGGFPAAGSTPNIDGTTPIKKSPDSRNTRRIITISL